MHNARFSQSLKNKKLKLVQSNQTVPTEHENAETGIWEGSYVEKNGCTVDQSCTTFYLTDIIDITNFFNASINRKARLLRKEGLTFQEISNHTAIAKTKIFRILNENSKAGSVELGTSNSTNGSTPYGYCLYRGRLVEDPREQKVVSTILSLWKSGLGFEAIAKALNSQRHVTKTKKAWTYFAVRSVVKRSLSKQDKPIQEQL